MGKKPTYEELEQRVDGLKKKARERARLDDRMQLLLLAVEQSSEGMAVVDLDGALEYLNDAFARMHGYSAKELIGKNLSILHTPQQMPSVEAANRQIKKTGNFKGEIWHVTRNGTEFPTLMHNSLLRDDTGNPIGIIGTLRDITDLKGKEAEIKASEVRFRELFNYMSSGVAVYEAKDNGNDFIFKDFNQAGERIENVKKENLLGKSVLEMFPGVKEFGLFDVFKRVWETGTSEHHPISLYKDERIIGWRENYIYKLRSGEIVAVYDDVTERKQVEKALRESEERYKSLFKNNHSVMLLIDPESANIIDANPAAISFYGWSREELTRKKITNINTLTKRQVFQAMKRAKTEQRRIFYFKHRLASGKIRDVEVYSGPIKVYGRELLYSIIHDITNRKQAELSLIERGKELENKTQEFGEVNAALRVLLKHRDEDKKELEEKVVANVKKLVFPYVEKLNNSRLNDVQMVYLNIIKSNLEDIITPFLHQLSSKYSDLTPNEIQVAGFVKDGKTTKEIAELLNSSTGTIDFHRNNLRKKLGLRNTKTNLRSFLLSLA